MTKDDVLFGYRQQPFRGGSEDERLGGVPDVRVHRSTYYACKRQVDRHGLEMLRPRERRRPQMPNALPKMIEERIVSFSIAHPRARTQARRLGAGQGEVGRDHRLTERRVEGALPSRAEHPREAPRADRRLRRSL
jgi:hypothetical protein